MKRLLRYASWLLPHGVHVLRERILSNLKYQNLLLPHELAVNATLKNRHQGQRCFILGNGPSAKQLDLTCLQGKTVFSVSNGYLHKGYEVFAPAYHCVPQISYGKMTEEDVIAWFKEMHCSVGQSELFLNETEAAIVNKHNLFSGRKVYYLALRDSFDDMANEDVIDISKIVPRVQSVPVMTLMIAMYMGFKEIIIIGVDHSELIDRKYTYAFDLKVQKGKDFSVNDQGIVVTSIHDDLQAYANLWRQYRCLRQIADNNLIKIFNASPGSMLDEFPKLDLCEVINTNRLISSA